MVCAVVVAYGLQDVKRAYDMGCEAIYLSNHGGRALDGYLFPPCAYISLLTSS